MKQLPLIASKLYTEPWHIRPDVHAEIGRQFRTYCERGGGLPQDAAGDRVGPVWRDWLTDQPVTVPQVRVISNVAIIPVHGIIGKHLELLEIMCGGMDLNHLCQQAKNVADDPVIRTAVLDLRTPGGVGIGLAEAADTLQDITRAGKKLVAWVDYQCCSAGYWLAAACQEIWAAPSACIGSIGTYIAALDASRAYEMDGFEMKVFRDGAVKGVGYPGKPWTPEEEAYMQALVEKHGRGFKDWISSRRGLGEDSMQGQWWPADQAPAGMVDGFARDLEDLLGELLS